jgi:hypothetical protein
MFPKMLGFETTTQWLEIPPALNTQAWQDSQSVTVPGQRWQAYLNQICFATIVPWIQEKSGQAPTLCSIAHPRFWQMVNGSALRLNTTQIVLIPQEAMDRSEFRVPQEWIDIPSWVGDYYLAVEVDADAREIEIWGYATHQMLKAGTYDPIDRTYCLDGDQVIQDLTVFWVMQQLATEPTRTEVAALPELTTAQAETLMQQLSDPAIVLPRLEVDFAQWGALLAATSWLQQMCEQQQTVTVISDQPIQINLSQWLQNVFETGWQAIEDLFGSTPDLAFSLRQENASEESIQRVKRIQLGEGLPDVLLVLMLATEADDRRRIWVQVLPWQGNDYLPMHLTLTLLSMSGATLQSVQAGDQSNYIQLRRFKCPPGSEFRLQVTIETVSVTESFIS